MPHIFCQSKVLERNKKNFPALTKWKKVARYALAKIINNMQCDKSVCRILSLSNFFDFKLFDAEKIDKIESKKKYTWIHKL